jgi:hypothetical protein
MHHTEQLVYFDLCEGGFYSVTADISRHRYRQVNGCRISFQLEGIPLDLDPFRTLARSFDGDFAFFRPRSKRSVKKRPIAQLGAPIGAKALIVQEIGGHGSDHEDWVIGVVLDDPGDGLQSADRTKLGLPTQPLDRWICTLDSWHPISAPQKYKVRSIESAWTSDAVAIHARADWVDSVERALAKDVVPVFDD